MGSPSSPVELLFVGPSVEPVVVGRYRLSGRPDLVSSETDIETGPERTT